MFAEAHLYLGVALAGLVSFLSPCVLPLVPPYLGYLGGTTIEEMTSEDELEDQVWRRVVIASLFFVLGFTTVFVALGASASVVGQLIQTYKAELAIAAGVVIILFGLHFLGVLPVPLLYRGDALPSRGHEPARATRAPTSSVSPSPSAGRRASVRSWRPCWRSPPTRRASGPACACSRSTRSASACRSCWPRSRSVRSSSFLQRFRRHLGLGREGDGRVAQS